MEIQDPIEIFVQVPVNTASMAIDTSGTDTSLMENTDDTNFEQEQLSPEMSDVVLPENAKKVCFPKHENGTNDVATEIVPIIEEEKPKSQLEAAVGCTIFPHPRLLDMEEDDCLCLLRDKEILAYRSVQEVFRAQGKCTDDKLQALLHLRTLLGIPETMHKALLRSAIADDALGTISDRLWGQWVDERWLCESRQRQQELSPGNMNQVEFVIPDKRVRGRLMCEQADVSARRSREMNAGRKFYHVVKSAKTDDDYEEDVSAKKLQLDIQEEDDNALSERIPPTFLTVLPPHSFAPSSVPAPPLPAMTVGGSRKRKKVSNGTINTGHQNNRLLEQQQHAKAMAAISRHVATSVMEKQRKIETLPVSQPPQGLLSTEPNMANPLRVRERSPRKDNHHATVAAASAQVTDLQQQQLSMAPPATGLFHLGNLELLSQLAVKQHDQSRQQLTQRSPMNNTPSLEHEVESEGSFPPLRGVSGGGGGLCEFPSNNTTTSSGVSGGYSQMEMALIEEAMATEPLPVLTDRGLIAPPTTVTPLAAAVTVSNNFNFTTANLTKKTGNLLPTVLNSGITTVVATNASMRNTANKVAGGGAGGGGVLPQRVISTGMSNAVNRTTNSHLMLNVPSRPASYHHTQPSILRRSSVTPPVHVSSLESVGHTQQHIRASSVGQGTFLRHPTSGVMQATPRSVATVATLPQRIHLTTGPGSKTSTLLLHHSTGGNTTPQTTFVSSVAVGGRRVVNLQPLSNTTATTIILPISHANTTHNFRPLLRPLMATPASTVSTSNSASSVTIVQAPTTSEHVSGNTQSHPAVNPLMLPRQGHNVGNNTELEAASVLVKVVNPTQVSLAKEHPHRQSLLGLVQQSLDQPSVPVQFSQIGLTMKRNLQNDRYINLRQFLDSFERQIAEDMRHCEDSMAQDAVKQSFAHLKEHIRRAMLTNATASSGTLSH